MRSSGRAADALRPVSFNTGFAHHAEGSCLIRMGGTEVLCTASVEGRVPGFLRGKGEGCQNIFPFEVFIVCQDFVNGHS